MQLAPYYTGTGQLKLLKYLNCFLYQEVQNLETKIGNTGKDFFLVRLYVIDEVIDDFGNDFGHGKEQSDDVILF